MANKYLLTTEIPYLRNFPQDGRSIPIINYCESESEQFYIYAYQEDHRVIEIPINRLDEGLYISKRQIIPETDFQVLLAETIIQYFSFKDLVYTYKALSDDLINGLASIQQYFVMLNHSNNFPNFADSLLVRINMEYAFANHRSFYDLLHKTICLIHQKYQKKSPHMSDSFEKYTKKSKKELGDVFLFPNPIIDFYKAREESFILLRELRNNIFHHGHTPPRPVIFEDGFACFLDDKLVLEMEKLKIWSEHLLKPNNLGSVLPVFAYLEKDMIDATNSLAENLKLSFNPLPVAVAPEYRVFLRSSVSYHLFLLEDYLKIHWFNPKKILNI